MIPICPGSQTHSNPLSCGRRGSVSVKHVLLGLHFDVPLFSWNIAQTKIKGIRNRFEYDWHWVRRAWTTSARRITKKTHDFNARRVAGFDRGKMNPAAHRESISTVPKPIKMKNRAITFDVKILKKIRDVFDPDGQLDLIAPKAESEDQRCNRIQLPVRVERISNFQNFHMESDGTVLRGSGIGISKNAVFHSNVALQYLAAGIVELATRPHPTRRTNAFVRVPIDAQTCSVIPTSKAWTHRNDWQSWRYRH